MKNIYLIGKSSYRDSLILEYFATSEEEIKQIVIHTMFDDFGDTVIVDSFKFDWDKKLFSFDYYYKDPSYISSETWSILTIKQFKYRLQ